MLDGKNDTGSRRNVGSIHSASTTLMKSLTHILERKGTC